MAVTNNVLNAINVFSSTSVFNSNKSSVGANDLNFIKQTTAELATEGGGIIAQSLGTNGYVKFANGLILQWGKGNTTTDRNNTVTLPVTYETTYACMVAQYLPTAQEKYTSQVLTTSTNSTLYLHWGRTYNSGNYVKWMTIGY